jgi:hypothetical protein
MGNPSERENTTRYATDKINHLLDNNDFTSAVLLTSIYVNMRLKTLITVRLNPPQQHWQDTSNAFNSLLGYKNLLSVCNMLGLMKGCNFKQLKDLWEKRCVVAHETELWKNISPQEQQEIRELCNSAIDFLKKTTG